MATNASLIDNEAFSQLVAEHNLRPYELGGYIYADKRGPKGIEIYRTYGPKWSYMWQAKVQITQDGAGGGALRLNLIPATGTTCRLISGYVVGPATNTTLAVMLREEDGNNAMNIASTAGAVSANVSLCAGIGAGGTATNQMGASYGLMLAGGQYISFASGGAAQTETLTVQIVLLLPITATTATLPTWTTTGSAGTPSAVGASSISAANTLVAVLLP